MYRALTLCIAVCAGAFAMACSDARPHPTPESLAESVREALSTPGRLQRQLRLAPLLDQLSPESLPAVLAVYRAAAPGASEAELEPFVDAWARFDGLAALEFARGLASEELRTAAQRAAMHSWAMANLPAALGAVRELGESEPALGRQLSIPLVRGWVHANVGGLENFLLENSALGDLLNAAIPELYRRDGGEGVLRWAEALIERSEDAHYQWLVFRKTTRAVGFRDPERAAHWVTQHYTPDGYARDGPGVLALAWLRTDPAAALDWLRSAAPQQTRVDATRSVFRRWLARNRQEALAWLESRPDDPFYDAAYDGLARELAEQDPDAALQECERMALGDLQSDCLAAVAEGWYGRDPLAAGRWMEDSALDAEAREAIRERWRMRRQMEQRRERPGFDEVSEND